MDVLEFINNGVKVPNPNYKKPSKSNPAGSPRFITSNDINDVYDPYAKTAASLSQYTQDLTPIAKELPEDAQKYGIYANRVDDFSELDTALNKAKAKSQSTGTQVARMTGRIANEVVVGSLAGIGDIIDGVINSFRGEDKGFYTNPYSDMMHNIKDSIDEKLEIYRENPEANWDVSDFGWWADNFVSTATTLSLMLPALGYGKVLGTVGKLSRVNNILGWGTNKLAKGIAKATSFGSKESRLAESFSAARQLANRTNKINNYINQVGKAGGHAVMSRMGEDMMEGRQTYDESYQMAKAKLDNMSDEEYTKFIINNPNLSDRANSKDDVAKAIASDAAFTTFDMDFAMILMDVPQFMALGRYFGNGMSRALTGADILAATNVARQVAGKELIKDNIKNRLIASGKYLLKDPLSTWTGLELGEGIEEMYQGIMQQKGIEVANKYFDPTLTTRGIESYLKDGAIWEQGFWGVVGGIVFKNAGAALANVKDKVTDYKIKKTSTAEEYEQYKAAKEAQKNAVFENMFNDMEEFRNKLDLLSKSKNPYSFVIDPQTGIEIIQNGQLINDNIDDTQRNLLVQRTLDEFITKRTLNAVSQGVYDLYSSVIKDPKFAKFIEDKTGSSNSINKELNTQIYDRMEDIASLFSTELSNAEAIPGANNPIIMDMIARKITVDKMRNYYNEQTITNINNKIAELDDTNGIYDNYQDKLIYDSIHSIITSINQQIAQTEKLFADNKISKAAKDRKVKELIDRRRVMFNTAAEFTNQGMFDQVKKDLADSNITDEELIKSFEEFYKQYNQSLIDANQRVPKGKISELMQQKAISITRRAFTKANIPMTEDDYTEMYNDFGMQYSKLVDGRINETVNAVKEYLTNAENYDDALAKVMNQSTGVAVIDNNMDLVKYGYVSLDQTGARVVGQTKADILLQSAIESARQERNKDEEIAATAESNGTTIVNKGLAAEQQNTSTGRGTQTPAEETKGTEETVNTEVRPTEVVNPAPTTQSTIPVAELVNEKPDTTIPVSDETEDKGDDSGITPDDVDAIQEQKNNSAYLEAGKFVIESLMYNPSLVQQLADTNGREIYDKFRQQLSNYLANNGYGSTEINAVIEKAISDSVNLIASSTNKSEFAKIAINMSVGYNPDSNVAMNAITTKIAKDNLNKTTDKFLENYAQQVKINPTSDGKYIINVESLFDYLINNPEINEVTAIRIYNNIVKYLSSNQGEKYLFTGIECIIDGYTADEFFTYIRDNKITIKQRIGDMHIFPVEAHLRDVDYDEALKAAHDGGVVFAERAVDADDRNTNIPIYTNYVKDGVSKRVQLGVVRAVEISPDNTTIYPKTHINGFRNAMVINGDNISLDCDFLFDALIESTDDTALDLFGILQRYNADVIFARTSKHGVELQKALNAAMSDITVSEILNNPLIVKLLSERHFITNRKTDKESAVYIADTISKILFYNDGFDENASNHLNTLYPNLDTAQQTMRANYDLWKHNLKETYKKTRDLQKALDTNNYVSIGALSVPYRVTGNYIGNREDYVNIDDAGIDPNRHIFVMVNSNHMYQDEKGNTYGLAPYSIGEYSTGFIVYKDDKKSPVVARCTDAVPIDGSPLHDRLKTELKDIILKQLANTNPSDHVATFNNLSKRLKDCLSYGLFRFDGVVVNYNQMSGVINVNIKNPETNQFKTVLTFFSKDNNSQQYNNNISVDTGIVRETLNGQSNDAINLLVDKVVNIITKNTKINRLGAAFFGGNVSSIYSRQNGKFIINLGGEVTEYDSYAQFTLDSRGFITNMDGTKQSFINKLYNERRISVRMNVGPQNARREQIHNKNGVSELFNSKDKSKNKYDTADILVAAGVKQDKIDVLTGVNTGIPFVTKSLYHVSRYTKKTGNTVRVDARAFYDGDIYITDLGVAEMNNDPDNALRLILHENLHRHFKSFTPKQRERIVRELREVYDYTREQLTNLIKNNHPNSSLYKDIENILNQATSYSTEEKNMEEFIVECLTQKHLADFLNKTDYKEAVNFAEANEANKTIFQKLIDIILTLLGIKASKFNNNSILAREYMILSRTSESTSSGLFNNKQDSTSTNKKEPINNTMPNIASAGTAVADNVSLPVEKQENIEATKRKQVLEDTTHTLSQVQTKFAERVKYSDNFAVDHKYYIDGVESEYSVTGVTHPSDGFDTVAYGASAGLGNMFDDASRVYFENDGHWPADYVIPNTVHEEDRGQVAQIENSDLAMKQTVEKIKDKLDEIYGIGRYKAFANEFPIAGQVKIDDYWHTIAGTTDLIVVTDEGYIDIYDFKTKRGGKLSPDTKAGYERQVNAYRQIIEENNQELKGRVRAKGLFVATTDYADGNNTNRVYSYAKEDVKQKQVLVNGKPIQDTSEDYAIPYFQDNFFVSLNDENISNEITALPEKQNAADESAVDETDISDDSIGLDDINFNGEDIDFEGDFAITDIIRDVDDFETEYYNDGSFSEENNINYATTDMIRSDTERHVDSFHHNNADNTYGISVAENMNDFLASVPSQFRANVKHLLAAGYINYTCQ